MAGWDLTKPADTDLVRNFPSAHRTDKTTLQSQFQTEHDVLDGSGTATGRHKFQVANEASLVALADVPIGSIAWALNFKRLRIKTATGPDTAEWLPFPSGTKMVFRQAAAPVGWTREVDAGNTDAVPMLRLNNEAPGAGGSWTITGLTADAHTHGPGNLGGTTDTSDSQLVEGGAPALAATAAHTHQFAVTTGATSTASANGVTSTGAWRPKFVDLISAVKD